MRNLLIMIALVGCGDSGGSADAPAALPDCATYCTTITTNCTGANAQYGGSSAADATAHCMATCDKFPVGTLADMGGQNTLGCRLYHAKNAMTTSMPAVHCPHAGPGGDKVDAAGVCGSPCVSFCTLEIAACGLSGAGTTGQYASMQACTDACANFDKTHAFTVDTTTFPSATPRGDSLACRLYHTTNALITGNAAMHCPHTKALTESGNPCFGAATP